jgi:hypothetical protein
VVCTYVNNSSLYHHPHKSEHGLDLFESLDRQSFGDNKPENPDDENEPFDAFPYLSLGIVEFSS